MEIGTALVIVGLGQTTVGKEVVKVVGDFTREVFGPTAKAAGQGIAAPIQAWADNRAQRAQQTIVDAALMLDEAGESPHPVPGRILMPLLEHASVEEDESLRKRYVALLATSATNPNGIPPSFPRILSELSPWEARVLEFLELSERDDQRTSVPQSLATNLGEIVDRFPVSSVEEALIGYSNFIRLGLIVPVIASFDLKQSGLEFRDIAMRLTPFGSAFISACLPKGASVDKSRP